MAVIELELVPMGEPLMSGRLVMDEEYIALFTTGAILKPRMSANFPADIIETNLEWADLILQQKVMDEINEIQTWLKFNQVLMEEWGLKGKVKPGYRVMFYGPPGTGKTLTASLLGKYTGRDVYRIDLSMVVSKYIGETEKTFPNSSIKPKTKIGFSFSMKPILYSENGPMFGMHMINMPTRKFRIYYNVSKHIPVW